MKGGPMAEPNSNIVVLALTAVVVAVLLIPQQPGVLPVDKDRMDVIEIYRDGQLERRTEYLGDGEYRTEIYLLPQQRTRDSTTIRPDSSTGTDTFIASGYPTYNYGYGSLEHGSTYTLLYVGKDTYTGDNSPALGVCRTLIRFDLSSLTNVISVESASIDMYYAGYYAPKGITFNVKMHQVTHSWVEGGGVGDTYSVGQGASWNTYDGTNNWAAAGGDFDTNAVAMTGLPVPADGEPDPWGYYSWDATVLVQKWLLQGVENDGVIFIYENEGLDYYVNFLSSEVSDTYADNRPKITITYTANQKPVAQILDYPQGTVYTTDEVHLVGSAYDNDGTVTGYKWTSNLNGLLGTEASIIVDNLTAGTHIINFSAVDNSGLWSDPVSVQITVVYNDFPSKVMGLVGRDTPGDDGGSITLEWVANTDDDFAQYNVYVETSPINSLSGLTPAIDLITTQSTTSVAISQLKDGTRIKDGINYYAAVTVTDIHGAENTQDFSAVGPIVSRNDKPPDPVSITSAYDTPNDNGGSITLEWEACQAKDFDHYSVYLDSTEFFDIGGMTPAIMSIKSQSVVSTEITGLTDGTEYWVAVVAVDNNGNVEVNVTPYGPVVPMNDLKPEALTVTVSDTPNDQGHSLTISWTRSNDPDFKEYRVFVSTYEGRLSNPYDLRLEDPIVSISKQATTSTEVTKSMDGDIQPNTDYYVVVAVVDTGGNLGDYSVVGPYQALDNIAPERITGVTAADTPDDNGGSITISWTQAGDSDFDHYLVYVTTDAQISPTTDSPAVTINDIATTTVVVNELDGKPLDDSEAYYVAVVAVDTSGNMIPDPDVVGPVSPRDNIPPVVDSYVPEEGNQTLDEGKSIMFQVKLASSETGEVSYKWYLDSDQVGKSSSYTLDYSDVSPGKHTVRVVVSQEDMKVSRTWNVTVAEPSGGGGGSASSKGDSYMYLIIGVIAVLAIVAAVIVVMRKKREEEETEEKKASAPHRAAYSGMVAPPTYMPSSRTNVYAGPYTTGEPLYQVDQSYHTYSGKEPEPAYREAASTQVAEEKLSDKLMKMASTKKKEKPEVEPEPEIDTSPKELAKLPVKKVPAYMAKTLEEREREEKRKKLEEKKRKGEICTHQNEDIRDYVCPPNDMKKCKLECTQKNVFAASKASALNNGKKVKRCVFQNAPLKVFVCPKNVRERCELKCTQKAMVPKKASGKDWTVCPKDWEKNKADAKKCKKCGTPLWGE